VGQNVSAALHYMGAKTVLCSAVGNDLAGKALLSDLESRGMNTAGIEVVSDAETAQYVAINDGKKDLVIAMADMKILEAADGPLAAAWRHHLDVCRPSWVVVDANWDASTLGSWIRAARAVSAKVAYEPVSVDKSPRIFGTDVLHGVHSTGLADLATPNEMELFAMHSHIRSKMKRGMAAWLRCVQSMLSVITSSPLHTGRGPESSSITQCALELLPFFPCILTKCGPKGVLLAQVLLRGDRRLERGSSGTVTGEDGHAAEIETAGNNSKGLVLQVSQGRWPVSMQTGPASALSASEVAGVYLRFFSPVEHVPEKQVVSVNGVGDTFLGVLVAGLAKKNPKPLEDLIDVAQAAAVMTLKSVQSVSPEVAALRSRL
jgi:pseudouridylate synthase / pseudouridine kinase